MYLFEIVCVVVVVVVIIVVVVIVGGFRVGGSPPRSLVVHKGPWNSVPKNQSCKALIYIYSYNIYTYGYIQRLGLEKCHIFGY